MIVFFVCFQSFSLPKVFRLFRALGLRHLVVTNEVNEVSNFVKPTLLQSYSLIQKKADTNVI